MTTNVVSNTTTANTASNGAVKVHGTANVAAQLNHLESQSIKDVSKLEHNIVKDIENDLTTVAATLAGIFAKLPFLAPKAPVVAANTVANTANVAAK